jgi:hypothetical protein
MRGKKFSRLSHCEQGVETTAGALAVFYQRVSGDQSKSQLPRRLSVIDFTTRLLAPGPSPAS